MNPNDVQSVPTERATTKPRARGWLVLVLMCTAQFLCVLDDTIVNVALPSIHTHLDVPDPTLAWVINGYLVTFGGVLLLGGRAADLFVRRTVFLTGLTVFGAASLGCGVALGPTMLILSRAVQGVGAALMSAAALAIVSVTFTGVERNRALGVWGALSGVAGVLGMLLGGLLTTWLSWRWVFLINVPIVLAVAVSTPRVVPPERANRRRRLDLLGAITGTGGIAMLVVTIVNTTHAGWVSATTFGCAATAIALLVVFTFAEARHPAPLLPLRVFRNRDVTGGAVCGILLSSAMLGLFFFLTLYLQRVRGYSPFQTGLAYLPMSAMVIVVAGGVAPRLAGRRSGARMLLMVGFALLTVALVWFARIDVDTGYLPNLLVPALVAGTGLGTTLVGVVTTVMRAFGDTEEAGLASGLVSTTQQLGGALGIAVLSAISFAHVDTAGGRTARAVALTDGIQLAFSVAAGLTVLGVAIAVFLAASPDTDRRTSRP